MASSRRYEAGEAQWTNQKIKIASPTPSMKSTPSRISQQISTSFISDHEAEDISAWSREMAEEELNTEDEQSPDSSPSPSRLEDDTMGEIELTSRNSSPPTFGSKDCPGKGTELTARGRAKRQLQLGEVNSLRIQQKGNRDTQSITTSFQTQLDRARRQLADLVQDKSELKERLASAIGEAGKQARRVHKMEDKVKIFQHKKADEVENISAQTVFVEQKCKMQLQEKDKEIAELKCALQNKDTTMQTLIRQQGGIIAAAGCMLKEIKSAKRDLELVKEGEMETAMQHQLLFLQRQLKEQSKTHEEELLLVRNEVGRYREAIGVMEERHKAAIEALMEQVVVQQMKSMGPQDEKKQHLLVERIGLLETECVRLQAEIMEGKTLVVKVLEEKDTAEEEAKHLREEKRMLLQEGRMLIQEREAEMEIVMEQLRMVLESTDRGAPSTSKAV